MAGRQNTAAAAWPLSWGGRRERAHHFDDFGPAVRRERVQARRPRVGPGVEHGHDHPAAVVLRVLGPEEVDLRCNGESSVMLMTCAALFKRLVKVQGGVAE